MDDKNNHPDNCDCGHDHDHEHDTIVITLEDDTELECEVLGIFDVEPKEYIALLPMGDETVLIYEYIENEEEVELKLIENEEEFQRVSDEFYELFDVEEDEEE